MILKIDFFIPDSWSKKEKPGPTIHALKLINKGDTIKENESDVLNIDFELQAKKR